MEPAAPDSAPARAGCHPVRWSVRRSLCHHGRGHEASGNGAVQNLRAAFDAPQLIDRGEINIARDKDIDELALILVQRGWNVDRLLDGDAGSSVGGSGGVVDLDRAVLQLL